MASSAGYPSIPTPAPTIAGLLATVTALQQAVQLLIVNSQSATQQQLTASSQVFAQSNSVAAQINNALGIFTDANNATAGSVAAVQASLTSEVATINADLTTINADLAALGTGAGLTGTVAGGNFTVTGAELIGPPNTTYGLIVPGSLIESATVTGLQLALNAATMSAGNITATTPATVGLTLPQAGSAILIISTTAQPIVSGSGIMYATVDGVDTNIGDVASTGGSSNKSLPFTGCFLATGLTAGAHTFAGRVEFSGTPINGISLVVIVLMR